LLGAIATKMALVSALFWLIRSLIAPRTSLVAENLALRQQLAVLNRKIHRPQLRRRDRFFWAPLANLEELAAGLDHCQTGDHHQMAQAGIQALLAMETQGAGRPSEDRQGDS
jgi:hypothetical protein